MLSFLDVVTSSSLLKLVRGFTAPLAAPKGKKKQKAEAEDMDIDDNDAAERSAPPASSMTTTECCIVINNLADLLQHFGIRDQPDIVRAVIETLAHVTRHCSAGVSNVAFHAYDCLAFCACVSLAATTASRFTSHCCHSELHLKKA